MTDPFDVLRIADEPVSPDARFAARLRARLAAALAGADLPLIPLPNRKDAPMPAMPTELTDTAPAETASKPAAAPAPSPSVVPYITVRGAVDALAWYANVFGAVETVRYTADDGRLGHAEMTIGGARLMLSDEYPEIDVLAPASLGGTTFALSLEVADVDDVHQRAVDADARSLRPPADQPYGDRNATILDPYGHRWMIHTTIAHPTTAEIAATIEGFTVTSPDEP